MRVNPSTPVTAAIDATKVPANDENSKNNILRHTEPTGL